MRRYYLLVLLFTSLQFRQGAAQVIHLDFVALSKEDSWSRVRGMVQDRHGFLWLATTDGLCQYDCFTSTAYHNSMGISKRSANKIFQPFFTTKPTGAECKEGKGSEFIIRLS